MFEDYKTSIKADNERYKAEREGKIKDAFDKWLQKPLVKMHLSTLQPPEGNPEDIVMLLRACFEEAYSSGEGGMAISMITTLMKPGPGGKPGFGSGPREY